jgi:putative ABC transport system permease protein
LARRRWRAWAAIGFLAGIVAGVTMTAVAGARRTDSSLHRVVVDTRAADVVVNPNNGALGASKWRRIERLPQVAEWAYSRAAPMVPLLPNGKPDLAFLMSARGASTFENPDGHAFHSIERPGLVAGRLPGPGETDAIVINEAAATLEHRHVGDRFRVGFFDVKSAERSNGTTLPPLHDFTLRVVGIVRPLDDATRSPDDPRLTPTYFLTRALSQRVAALGSFYEGLAVRFHNPRQLAAFEQDARGIAGANVLDIQELGGTLQRARRAIRPYVLALWLFAALAALAGAAVVAQIASRQHRLESSSDSVLRALGLTRAQLTRIGLLKGALIGAVAAVVAIGVAIAASPIMPIGPLRLLEPHRGVDIDFAVVGVGALVVVVLVVAQSALGAGRRRLHPATRRTPRLEDRLARAGASPTVVTGVRLALDPGRGDGTIPVRSTLFGVALAVAALVATLVYSAGLTHFTSTPRMYGWVWSFQLEPTGQVTAPQLERAIIPVARDRRVRAAAAGAYAQLTIAGKTIGAIAVQHGHGVPVVEIVNGREPARRDEIALGGTTLRSLHRSIGSVIAVGIGGVVRRFRVVGRAVFARFAPYPASEPTGLGVGAAMTLDGLSRFGPLDDSARSPMSGSPFALVDTTPGTTASALERLAFPGQPGAALVLTAQRPNDVSSYQHLDRTPLALAGLLALLAIATTVHLLVSAVRRRRRDLGVLRALGFTAAQLRLSVLVQAVTLVGLGLLVAIPAGVIAGRMLWGRTASWLGIAQHGFVPVPALALAALAALVVAAVVALVPAISAGRVDPAEILRSE